MATVSIRWTNAPDVVSEVKALSVYGLMAVHHSYRREDSGLIYPIPNSYMVTHMPTGAGVHHADRLASARRIAKALAAHPAFGPSLTTTDRASISAARDAYLAIRDSL